MMDMAIGAGHRRRCSSTLVTSLTDNPSAPSRILGKVNFDAMMGTFSAMVLVFKHGAFIICCHQLS